MVVSQMPRQYRSVVSTLYQDRIVTLFGILHDRMQSDKEKAFFDRVAAFLSPTQTGSGISPAFDDISDVYKAYCQARLSAMLSDHGCRFYEQLYPAPVFQAALESYAPEVLVHPALAQLLLYDKENGTQYFETLRAYSLTLHNR